MAKTPVNELTFVARLGAATTVRAERRRDAGLPVLIASGEIEERQVDALGRVRRCDIRLNTKGGRKLASGEMKRPEVPEGRDPRNEALRLDARRKAIARGLPYYFTCNMAEVVLYAVSERADDADVEEASFTLAPITHSSEVDAYRDEIAENWTKFLDDIEQRIIGSTAVRPSVATADVIAIKEAIFAVADEAKARVLKRLETDDKLAEQTRYEATETFQFGAALNKRYRAQFESEVTQILRLGVFVIAQKLILYRVLEDTGPKRAKAFRLDKLDVPTASSDPKLVSAILTTAISQAISRSGDYETAFLPEPLHNIVFLSPEDAGEAAECRVGEVWKALLDTIESVSWVSISRNLIGLIYEIIVDEEFRHTLGQFYTREDVVDLLATYSLHKAGDIALDPASGGGSFLRAAYLRKRSLGETHEAALSSTWGIEVTAFAAELSTITLATSDTRQPAAYPRVMLSDFFDVKPGLKTDLKIPDVGTVIVPLAFDAVIGNPPYISYRHQTNQGKVVNSFASLPDEIALPKFSGKSDAYVWFVVHATRFLREGGRLGFVVSSAILFSDYGIPLIRFLSRHYKIQLVVDSLVERWFPDADTNTVLLMLERCSIRPDRLENPVRFVRLRRPLAQLLKDPASSERRDSLEGFISELLAAKHGDSDPRMTVNVVKQGEDAGLEFAAGAEDDDSGEEE